MLTILKEAITLQKAGAGARPKTNNLFILNVMEKGPKFAIKRNGEEIALTWEEMEKATKVYVKAMARAIVETIAPELSAQQKNSVATKGTARFIQELPQAICYKLEIPE
jgi:hypothetical protein